MKYEFVNTNFATIVDDWNNLLAESPTACIFSTPEWVINWWHHFKSKQKLLLGFVRDAKKTIGIAPLMIENHTAEFIGSVDVCDYLDFVIRNGFENDFFKTLIERLKSEGITRLELKPVRPDSKVMSFLPNLSRKFDVETVINEIDMSLYLELPHTWDDYLQLLTRKQRTELKRKMRRLDEMGEVSFRALTRAKKQDIDMFLSLFRTSRKDKAEFLTTEMESFFRAAFKILTGSELFRLNFLMVNNEPIAATICFECFDEVYLYNSGYNRKYNWLSVGLISKALCIKDSIERNKTRFDFLKGNEPYKYHLGGVELPLYKCIINLS